MAPRRRGTAQVPNHREDELAGLTVETRVIVIVFVLWLYDALWLLTMKLA